MKLLPLGLALALLGIPVAAASATVAAISAPERQIMAAVNEARAANGLVPLRSDYRLWALADDRASVMASTNTLSHEAAGPIDVGLERYAIQWYGYGEVIAYSTASGSAAAAHLFQLWLTSPPHWALLTSRSFNYLGVGVAVSGSGRTYGSIVLTESKDRTGAHATLSKGSVTGDDVRWSWSGSDPDLQSHTAGLRDFAVQQRTDNGGWVTVSTGTTSTSRTAINRARSHWYGLRVRARDRAGNTGPWSAELRVWVP